MNLVCGDSLLARQLPAATSCVLGFHELAHAYRSRRPGRASTHPASRHATTPSWPTRRTSHPRTEALNQAYRERYSACHMQYSLAVPFMERLFIWHQPSVARRYTDGRRCGYVGQITANSFMKREFGKKLIEQFLPTSGPDARDRHQRGLHPRPRHAHGDPVRAATASRSASTIRTVMGIRGEPSTPDDPVTRPGLVRDRRPDGSARFAERVRQRRRLAAGAVSQAPLVDRWRWRCRTEGAVGRIADSRLLDECTESLGSRAFTREDDIFIYASHQLPSTSASSRVPSADGCRRTCT